MSSLKQRFSALLLLSALIVPAFLRSGTILDAQERIALSLKNNSYINPHTIENIIQEMINANRMEDVRALEIMLLEFKQKFIEKQPYFFNQRFINFLRNTADIATCATVMLTLTANGGVLAAILEDIFLSTSDSKSADSRCYTLLGLGFLGTGIVASFDIINQKIKQLQNRYTIWNTNKHLMDELLAYLYFHKGIAIGLAER